MTATAPAARLMSGADYRESLRRYSPTVFVNGRRVASVADERAFQPGLNAIALTYDYALKPEYARLMTALQHSSGKVVNRLSHIDMSSGDLLNKLEAVRLVCQETGCAQRYLTHDALNAIGQVSARIDDARGTTESTARFLNYLHRVQDQDLTLGVAMTDAKGDRSLRPFEQSNPDSYVRIVERNAVHNGQRGIVISGTKAIVTGAPYMHELLVMPCRNMGPRRRRLCRLLRRADRRAGPDHRRPPCRPPGRNTGARRRAVQPQVRPEHRRVPFRARVRAHGRRVLRRRMGAFRPPDLQLRHAPSPHLHRRARRFWRPADRRRCADVRGQRL